MGHTSQAQAPVFQCNHTGGLKRKLKQLRGPYGLYELSVPSRKGQLPTWFMVDMLSCESRSFWLGWEVYATMPYDWVAACIEVIFPDSWSEWALELSYENPYFKSCGISWKWARCKEKKEFGQWTPGQYLTCMHLLHSYPVNCRPLWPNNSCPSVIWSELIRNWNWSQFVRVPVCRYCGGP